MKRPKPKQDAPEIKAHGLKSGNSSLVLNPDSFHNAVRHVSQCRA